MLISTICEILILKSMNIDYMDKQKCFIILVRSLEFLLFGIGNYSGLNPSTTIGFISLSVVDACTKSNQRIR
jgi:hypothetical protein